MPLRISTEFVDHYRPLQAEGKKVGGCCGQLIPDSKLSFSSAIAGATIWLWLCGLRQL